MIIKSVPGFCFVDPKNRNTINLRLSSIRVTAEPRRIRMTWNPELAQDLQAFHNFDAEAELTALLAENIQQEVDRQIIQDLTNPQERWIRQWVDLIRNQNDPLIHHGHRAPQDNPPPDFGGIQLLPLAQRVHTRTVGLDLVTVQPLTAPLGILNYLDFRVGDDGIYQQNYTILPNDEGWYSDGTFDSIFIKMDIKPHKFIQKIKNTRRYPPNYFTRPGVY